jgi:hypothetical protein
LSVALAGGTRQDFALRVATFADSGLQGVTVRGLQPAFSFLRRRQNWRKSAEFDKIETLQDWF